MAPTFFQSAAWPVSSLRLPMRGRRGVVDLKMKFKHEKQVGGFNLNMFETTTLSHFGITHSQMGRTMPVLGVLLDTDVGQKDLLKSIISASHWQ